MKKITVNSLFFLCFLLQSCNAQEKTKAIKQPSKYVFTPIKEIAHTPIAYQDMTGTCWAFAMTSLMEAEIIRKTGKTIDLSEMYVVRNNYVQKAYAHIMRHGQFPFAEGGLNPDALEAIAQYGLIPYENYTGLKGKDKYHDHRKLLKQLQEILPDYAKKGIQNEDWKTKITHAIDKAMEKTPTDFTYNNQNFTPESFLKHTTINPDDYVHITSFNHKPFYKNMVLDVEWNINNKAFYNVPIDDFWTIASTAIDNGYTLAVELDVSEKGYSGDYGIAVVAEKEADSTLILYNPTVEKRITQTFRQQEFENFHTINDHNQHIVGKVKDQNGKVYFIAKNSWRGWNKDGYIFISEAYFKLKVLYFTVHKDMVSGKYKNIKTGVHK